MQSDDATGAADPSEILVQITPAHGLELPPGERLREAGPLLLQWIRRELRVRYRQSVLRAAWTLLQPVTILVTYGWVLTRVLDVGSEDVPYLTFAWAGIVPFTFLQQSLGQGVGSIQQSGPLIARVYFPREVLPLSVVGCAGVDLGVMTALLIAVSWVQVGPPTPHLLGLLLVDLVLLLWTAGLTLLVSSVTVFRRDLNHAMPLILRVLFIISPVMYSAALVPRSERFNPIAAAIEGTRDATYRQQWPDMAVLGPHLLVGAAVLAGGYLVLRRLEPRMGDFA